MYLLKVADKLKQNRSSGLSVCKSQQKFNQQRKIKTKISCSCSDDGIMTLTFSLCQNDNQTINFSIMIFKLSTRKKCSI